MSCVTNGYSDLRYSDPHCMHNIFPDSPILGSFYIDIYIFFLQKNDKGGKLTRENGRILKQEFFYPTKSSKNEDFTRFFAKILLVFSV